MIDMIRIYLHNNEYELLSSTPEDKRVIQCGKKLYQVVELNKRFLRAKEILPIGIPGKSGFKEEKSEYERDNQEWLNSHS